MERFMAYLTEIYKGAFPTWLAPQQVNIIPVSDDRHGEYADQVAKELKHSGQRLTIETKRWVTRSGNHKLKKFLIPW